ncbi:MAG: CvpA family protein [Chloroflexi bacterium]|nr:CvpA family protein [Chloroflexota bacterium]
MTLTGPLLLDLLVLGWLIYQMISGIRRGFLLGVFDLAGWVVTIALTLLLWAPVAALLEAMLKLPKAVAGLAASFLVLLLASI